MLIQPKTRGFICTTAHPEGCRENVRRQMAYVQAQPRTAGPRRVLVLGASTGYGLASRIAAAFSCEAATIGVIFDKPAAGGRTASAGWYNTAAFESFAADQGLYAHTLCGDAFSLQIKQQTAQIIRQDLGTVDLVIYSLASPRRTMPDGTLCSSVLKTTGEAYTNKTIDLKTNRVEQVTIPAATPQEIEDTVHVMGGEDWMDWMCTLADAGVLAPGARTVAYSYIGPELTHPVYLNGSIGCAKAHLYETARAIGERFPGVVGEIAVNKALVTQSSAAIPIVPLYISLLYRVMKEQNLHEGCIEQMYRLFSEKLAQGGTRDAQGRIRLDDYEMRSAVQDAVATLWEDLDDSNVAQRADIEGYWEDFYQMFGFRLPGVDYQADVSPNVPIPSLVAETIE